ncbi:hypothetical protein [Peribacillus deserti]|uniref:Uncharacterized protein n=1 Tax=Peribacillus deserti TaxID=673318 RepID=A0A2N5M9G6_9BACI|nr:hypothetical protein [Peribacillus deserti]PLT30963.1 hypothetical protein CUU66_05285 [Peribacillus deserti]
MEALVDILFGNAFFIIIILGILSSLYKRLKMDGKAGRLKKAYKGTDPFGGPSLRNAPSGREGTTPLKELPAVEPSAFPVYHDEGLAQAINSEHSSGAIERKAATARVAVGDSKETYPRQETLPKLEFGQNQILQGIMMAEILGKPKGYTSRYRRAKSATVLKK